MRRFDVIVVGGGPAGCAAAITAASVGMQVALVEKSDYSKRRIGEHIAPETAVLLRELGVDAETCRFTYPCHSVTVDWGSDELRETNYFFNAYGSGYNADRAALDRALFEESRVRGAVCFESAVAELSWSARGLHCRINTAQTRQEDCLARYVVDATGRTASVAKWLGGGITTTDNLISIHCIVRALIPQTHTLHVAAFHDGWLYYAPLPGNKAVIAVMTDADILKGSTLSPAAFWLQNVRASALLADAISWKGDRSVVVRSARSQFVSVPCRDCFIAAGDALMTFDPLSSDGIRKGIRSGIEASKMLSGTWNETERVTFSARCRDTYSAYLRERSAYYQLEQRWPRSLFWGRRHSEPTASLSRASLPGITA